MQTSDILSGAVAIGGVLVAVLAYFKWKPGQREHVDMTVAQANMNVAQGTFQLVTTELEDQFKRMAAENAEIRAEMAAYREAVDGRIAELSMQLRGAKAENLVLTQENEHYKAQAAENEALRRRVGDLEAEVRTLKADRA